tara:strand:+ start:463 stop:891 length:429 start_codon:yes stop_codon:yes gene_type:complete
MASILKVDTITGVTTAGSIAVTGEGNSTTTNLQQGLCKAWGQFVGTGTPAFGDVFNVSGITDNGTGDYTFPFSSAMVNNDYSSTFSANSGTTTDLHATCGRVASFGTSSIRVLYTFAEASGTDTGTKFDPAFACLTIHGDLA